MLELVGLGSDADAAVALATELGGTCYVAHPGESERRPFSALVRIDTDEIERVRAVSDVALHVCHRRVIKPEVEPPPSERVLAVFGLVHHPDLDHRAADDHWRDIHAPLALVNHAAMCDYTQLSVVGTLSGDALDGFALCAFVSRDELRARFFNDEAAKAIIEADVASFADPARSPRRVVMTQAV